MVVVAVALMGGAGTRSTDRSGWANDAGGGGLPSEAIARNLRARGYDVVSAIDRGWETDDDEPLLALCDQEQRALLTNNVAGFAVISRNWAVAARRHAGVLALAALGSHQMLVDRHLEAEPTLRQALATPRSPALFRMRSVWLRCGGRRGSIVRRDQLEHLIRAAGSLIGDDTVIVIGSQAILATVPAPAEEALMRSLEADLLPAR